MTRIAIVGDGPGGLSAALFLAKSGMDVVVFGQNKTAMNFALLKNYLGVENMLGSEFQKIARQQVVHYGAQIRDERIESVAESGDGYSLTTEGGETVYCGYLILSEGKTARLAGELGLRFDEAKGVSTNKNGKTKLDGVYVIGRSARPGRSQAIISAGDGAAAAVDIMSTERGEAFSDWDSPKK